MDQSDFRKLLFAKKSTTAATDEGSSAAAAATALSRQHQGMVKTYNPEKGFGFIIPDAQIPGLAGDLFVHKKALRGTNVLRQDQRVHFQLKEVNGRMQAADVGLGDAPPSGGSSARTYEDALAEAGGDAGKIQGLVMPKAVGSATRAASNWSSEWHARAEEAKKRARRPLTGEQKKQMKVRGVTFSSLCNYSRNTGL
eukprot:SAG31_NODE_8091_length_1524_cov_2.705965_2_plen_197_part_00